MLIREFKGSAILKVDGKSSKVALSNRQVPLALDRRGLPLHPHSNRSVPMNRKKSRSGIPGCSQRLVLLGELWEVGWVFCLLLLRSLGCRGLVRWGEGDQAVNPQVLVMDKKSMNATSQNSISCTGPISTYHLSKNPTPKLCTTISPPAPLPHSPYRNLPSIPFNALALALTLLLHLITIPLILLIPPDHLQEPLQPLHRGSALHKTVERIPRSL